MNKKTSEIQTSGYRSPECETIEISAVQLLCASNRKGSIDALTVEEEDPFNWI